MTSVTLPANPPQVSGQLRPLNVLRDLPRVADLIEICFASSMDSEGQSYVQQMRRASRDASFLRWASSALETASMPLSGYVWEQDGLIIGNASLVPFRYNGRRINLIANVATHPSYRRRGIARALTERAMQHARQRGVNELWLHVRADNPGAIQMYTDLGFEERARRTTWRFRPEKRFSLDAPPRSGYAPGLSTVTKRYSRFWTKQLIWLNQLHPAELNWYRSLNWNNLRPGLWSWLYRAFIEFDQRQWAVQKRGRLQGVLAWVPTLRNTPLWLACESYADSEAITTLLIQAQRDLGFHRNMVIEHPYGLQEEALQTAGFDVVRTLIWMRA